MKTNRMIALMTAFVAVMYSCTEEIKPDTPDNGNDDKIFLWLDKPQTKVVYADSLGTSGVGEKGFSMNWELRDSLYAIRWSDDGKATNNYIILETTQIEGESGKMLFQGTTRGNWNLSDLKGGEHFILVHGHFVLDPSKDNGVIDFPTSEVTKAGYANNIHHGGVVGTDGSLTFRNQTGTLSNLKHHEYMVADAYVRFQNVTEKDENNNDITVRRPYLGKERKTFANEEVDLPEVAETQAVQMLSAHTLLRLTMFVPNDMFNEIDYRLLAISLRTESNEQIFHRYFRLHPNTRGTYGPSGWKVDWNDNSDKESNIYFRANLPGTRSYNEINDPAQKNVFDPGKTVCVAGKQNGVDGHFVTLYFSLPSRPLAKDVPTDAGTTAGPPCKLFVSAFTRTHAYRTKKSYSIANDKMAPGKVVSLNVNFASGTQNGTTYTPNYISTKAITDPNLGVTFSPGLIYATKENIDDINWKYGIYDNQGEYAGLDQQTDVMGDYFIFGSIEPRQVFHQRRGSETDSWVNSPYWNPNWRLTEPLKVTVDQGKAIAAETTDVAALAEIDGHNNIFSTMSKKESERVWARIRLEAEKGVNRGYYYYDAVAHDTDEYRHTAHQAKGAHRESFLNSGGNETSENIEKKKKMSSTIGIWIGINRQPTLEEQDKFVFLPSSNQLNNATNNMVGYDAELTGYEDAQHYRYWASRDYGAQHVTCKTSAEYNALNETEKARYVDIPTKRGARDQEYVHHYYLKSELEGPFEAIMKFSTNTRDLGTPGTCERFQVWLNADLRFNTNSGIKPMDQTFGRVVRPVIY